MLLCFGAAWPFSLYKSYVSGQNGGKSVVFLFIVLAGYMAGLTHKYFYSKDLIIYLYVLNFVMVLADIIIYFRNQRIMVSDAK